MGASHNAGVQRGSRIACEPNIHTIPIDFNSVSGTAYKLMTFKVPTSRPLLIRSNIIIAVNEPSTTATVSVGTASGGAQWHSAFNLKQAAQIQSNNALGGAGQWIIYSSADLTGAVVAGLLSVWMTVTRTGAATGGKAYLVIEAAEVNVKSLGRAV